MIHGSFSLFRLNMFYSVTLILNLYFYTVSWICLWIALQLSVFGRILLNLCIGDACAILKATLWNHWLEQRGIHIFQSFDSDTEAFSWSSQYESTCTQGITAMICFDPMAFILKKNNSSKILWSSQAHPLKIVAVSKLWVIILKNCFEWISEPYLNTVSCFSYLLWSPSTEWWTGHGLHVAFAYLQFRYSSLTKSKSLWFHVSFGAMLKTRQMIN